jgi:hypothetical protein
MWVPFDGFEDKGGGLIEAFRAAGVGFRERDRVYETDDLPRALAIQSAFDPLAHEKTQALARLAEKRWAVQSGGFTVNGVTVGTDSDALARLTGAYNLAASGAQSSFRFKSGAGVFVELNAAQMTGLFQAVAAFIQACYDREKELSDAIAAETDWRAVRMFELGQGWPG